MYVLVTYRDEENQIKNEGARVITTLSNYILENQTHSNFYGSPCYLQMRKIHSKMKVLEW